MKHEWRKTWLALLVIVATGIWTGAASHAVESRDILGTWCSATAKIRFTEDTMKVTLSKTGRSIVYKVARYDFASTSVRVTWVNLKKEEVWADYSEFSADGRTMYLQKNRVAPRREYNRC